MFTLKSAGKCFLYTKCGCIPGSYTEKMFQKLFVARPSGTDSAWDYLKEKLGFQKKITKRDVREEIDPRCLEPENIEIPVHSNSNSTEEMWKPGYRGRTENKRY